MIPDTLTMAVEAAARVGQDRAWWSRTGGVMRLHWFLDLEYETFDVYAAVEDWYAVSSLARKPSPVLVVADDDPDPLHSLHREQAMNGDT